MSTKIASIENIQPKHPQGELLQEGKTLFILHETGKFYKGEKELCNKFYFSIQPDYARGITDEDAEKYATEVARAVNMHGDLVRALKQANEYLENREIHIAEFTKLLKQAESK